MLINQNTTQENLKKCSQKKKRTYKYLAILTIVIVFSSMLCVNASALVIQDITSIEAIYPELEMYIVSSDLEKETLVQISGIGKESLNTPVIINTENGIIQCSKSEQYYINETGEQYTTVYAAEYMTQTPIRAMRNSNKLNMNIWEWSQKYEDNIIWQFWTGTQINAIYVDYIIELPYFNNSIITGTEPLELEINKEIQANLTESGAHRYNIEIPKIDEIIDKAIEVMENDSLSEITFQYKGEQLKQNNYITNVYAENQKISIDFKKALSTILVDTEIMFKHRPTDVDILRSIGIVNYNDKSVNHPTRSGRENDFKKLVIENEFERSAEITTERQEKEVRLLNWLGNAIAGVMNVEIFPNFSLGGLLSVIIMIPIILWILKIVAGG